MTRDFPSCRPSSRHPFITCLGEQAGRSPGYFRRRLWPRLRLGGRNDALWLRVWFFLVIWFDRFNRLLAVVHFRQVIAESDSI